MMPNTYSRLPSGKFSVRLPFKEVHVSFPKSFYIAKQSLIRMEKRLFKNQDLCSHYHEFFKEYLDLGHMRKLGDETSLELIAELNSYYIPHHGIFQGDPANLKFRIVFNASAKSSNHISLNDTLFSGPSLQSNITDILIQCRSYRYVYSADIQKMYRQIEIHPDDRKFQRILWRDSPTDPVSVFELCTVTYGIAPSAYQALRSLRQLAIDECIRFPHVSQFVSKNMYVDDAFFGADTIDEAQLIAKEFTDFLMAGGFPLRKWAANHTDLLVNIPSEWLADSSESAKVLGNDHRLQGIVWNPHFDEFSFTPVSSQIEEPITKRKVLSLLAKLYDPLGLLSPVTIKAKMFFQSLWNYEMRNASDSSNKSKLSWDDTLTEVLSR